MNKNCPVCGADLFYNVCPQCAEEEQKYYRRLQELELEKSQEEEKLKELQKEEKCPKL
jgi:predicted amidophosphoribosyltransferase